MLFPCDYTRCPEHPAIKTGVCNHSPRDAAVGGHDKDRRHVTLQGPIEEGEALNVQHVNLIDEQHLEAIGHMSHSLPAPLFTPPAPNPGHLLWPLTPGMISALPSSRHSATLALICSRTSDLISPVSPAGDRWHQRKSERGQVQGWKVGNRKDGCQGWTKERKSKVVKQQKNHRV